MSSQKVYFITGANRGIGFELLKQLTEDSSNVVIGSARDLSKATELNKLIAERKNVHGVTLDVSSPESIDKLDAQLQKVAKDGVDVLVANAGIAQSNDNILDTPRSKWYEHYTTNVSGPIEVTKIVKPYLDKKESKQLVYVSSAIGSLTNFLPFPSAAYGQSKAALNFTVLGLNLELKEQGYTVIALHPGLVLTDMGINGSNLLKELRPELADTLEQLSISPKESVSGIINNVLKKITKEDSGKFYVYDGSENAY